MRDSRMKLGINPLDRVLTRWKLGGWSGSSLLRSTIVLLLLGAALLFPSWRVLSRRFARHAPRRFLIASAACFLTLTIVCLWPLNEIEWSVIDDHDILAETNREGDFTFGDFLEKLRTHKELGGALDPRDNLARFRPAYFSLRYLEVWLWQENPHAWGRARIGIAALSLWLIFLTLSRLTDPFFAAVLSASLITFPCWPDTWRYLGRAEIYACFGLALNLFGFALLWGCPPRIPRLSVRVTVFAWLAMLLGFLIALGAKENFIVLLGPIGLIYARNLWKKIPVTLVGHLSLLLSLAAIVLLGLVLKYKLGLSAGLDIYGRSTESGQRLAFLFPAIKAYFLSSQGLVLLGFAFLAVVFFWWRSRSHSSPAKLLRSVVRDIVIALGLSSTLFVSQYVFYVGALQNRYRFPAEFTWFLALTGLGYFLTTSSRLRELKLLRWRAFAWRGVSVLALLPALVLGPHRLTGEVVVRVDQTRRFEKFLGQFASLCRQHPERPVVIEATQVYAFEPAYAMPILLRHFGIANPLYHRYVPRKDLTATESPILFERLVNDLTSMSREGKFGYRPWPAEGEAAWHHPFVIGLDSDVPVTRGDWQGRAPW